MFFWKKFIVKQYRKLYLDRLEEVKKRMAHETFKSKTEIFNYLKEQPELRRFMEFAETRLNRSGRK